MYRAVLYGSPYHLTFSFLATRQSCVGGGGGYRKRYAGSLRFHKVQCTGKQSLDVTLVGFLSRHKFKKCALFECQCIWHECTNWEHYEVFLRTCLESGPPF